MYFTLRIKNKYYTNKKSSLITIFIHQPHYYLFMYLFILFVEKRQKGQYILMNIFRKCKYARL